MTNLADKIIDQVIAREGGFVDDPMDSGGATNHGITQKLARSHGYDGPMGDLSRADAVQIYKDEFWTPAIDQIAAASPRLAAEVFDTSVNMGPGKAAKFLQKALALLVDEQIDQDGIIGTQTISALQDYLEARRGQGEWIVMTAVNCLQGAEYIRLAERRKKDRRFLAGWLGHRIIL